MRSRKKQYVFILKPLMLQRSLKGLNIPQSEEFYVFFRFFLLTKQVTLESEEYSSDSKVFSSEKLKSCNLGTFFRKLIFNFLATSYFFSKSYNPGNNYFQKLFHMNCPYLFCNTAPSSRRRSNSYKLRIFLKIRLLHKVSYKVGNYIFFLFSH